LVSRNELLGGHDRYRYISKTGVLLDFVWVT
jgi:hypothetical protein